jgi:tRNA(fMet)-specific endonuclease VapC
MSFLLDTDICSAHLKQRPALTHRILQHTGRLYISTVTLGELSTWAKRANAPVGRLQSLRDFLLGISVLSVDEQVAEKFGAVRAALFDAGKPAPDLDLDLLIAATALRGYPNTAIGVNRDLSHV